MAAGIDYEILPTVANGDYSFVREKIIADRVTDVVICGGDGSVNTVTRQLYNTGVNFGIVPMGSGNGLAFAAKIPKAPARAIDIVLAGHATYIDAFTINDEFACMLCGLGFDAQVAHDFANQKKRGIITYIRLSLMNYLKGNSYTLEIEANGQTFTVDAYFMSIANSNQFGNHITIAPKASLSDGLLDIIIVPRMNRMLFPVAMLRQISLGKHGTEQDMETPGISYFQTSTLKVINHSGAPLHIDGEPHPMPLALDIKVLPACFKLLQPKKSSKL